jgi:small-conductance mechanosensitive channel
VDLLNVFRQPVFQRIIWSGVSLVLTGLTVYLLQRFIRSRGFSQEQKQLYTRWILYLGISVLLVLMVRIWTYQILVDMLGAGQMEKAVSTLITVLAGGLVVVFSRYFVGQLKLEQHRKRRLKRFFSYGVLFLVAFFQIRIWAYEDLFRIAAVKKLFVSLIVLGVIYLGLFFIRRLINSLKIDITTRHRYRKKATYLATFLYIVILIPIWAGSTNQWATVLSVMGAGIALALHEVLLNIAGWVYIVIRHPYKAGDRIELGDIRGDVIDIQLFQTSLLEIGNWVGGDQSTGRLVHLPHGQIFRKPLYNYTKGFEYIWNELSVLVTFESNWERCKEILLECGEDQSRDVQEQVQREIDRMAQEYLIYYKTFTPIVYTRIEESGVALTLRYLTKAKSRRTGEDKIHRQVLHAIQEAADIEFAYPTYRIYRRGEDRPSSGGGKQV